MPDALRVRLLGEFHIDGVDLASLRSRQARRLLKRLALHAGSVVDPDRLIDSLWGDRPPADPAADLSVLVSRARTLVGSDRLVRRDGGYSLLVDWSDRDEFTRLAAEAARRQSAGDLAGTRAVAAAALALVRGPLLADEPDADWVVPARVAMQSLIAEVRYLSARSALDAGLLGDAVEHAAAALADDPYDERAVRTMMAAHVGSGRSASALAVYANLRRRLIEDLGVDPSAETEAMHTSILVGDVPARHHPPSAETSFVGREGELAILDRALERSHTEAQVAVVTGEPGVGTSTLLREWAARARARGVLVVEGTARSGVDLALHPVMDALADLTRAVTDERDDSEPVGLRPPGPGAADAALHVSMFDRVRHLLDSVRPTAGVAVVIDDAHLADAVTFEWLSHVLHRRSEHRLLVVAAIAEGEDTARAGGAPTSTIIRLTPLARDQAALLVGADRLDELWPLAGGNPLLLVELAGRGQDGSIPATIRDAVADRLQRAGAAAGTLRTAAVLGASIDLDLLAGVLGQSPLELLDHLDEGVRRAFLTERAGALVFRHELVRQAAAADANVARRAFLHREAARWLSGREPADATDPLDVARHAQAGGDSRLAAEYFIRAATVAREHVDLGGAEAMLDQAVALHDTAAARLARSRVRMARGDLAGADDDASSAMALGAGAEALELRAWAARNRHDMDAAIRLGRAGATASSDSSITASCLMAVAFAHRGNGDLRATDALLGEARALDLSRQQSVDAWMGVLRVHQGRPDEALAALEPLLGAEPADLHSFWVEHVLQMTAHAYGLVGRVGDAFTVLDRLDAELRRRGTTDPVRRC